MYIDTFKPKYQLLPKLVKKFVALSKTDIKSARCGLELIHILT